MPVGLAVLVALGVGQCLLERTQEVVWVGCTKVEVKVKNVGGGLANVTGGLAFDNIVQGQCGNMRDDTCMDWLATPEGECGQNGVEVKNGSIVIAQLPTSPPYVKNDTNQVMVNMVCSSSPLDGSCSFENVQTFYVPPNPCPTPKLSPAAVHITESKLLNLKQNDTLPLSFALSDGVLNMSSIDDSWLVLEPPGNLLAEYFSITGTVTANNIELLLSYKGTPCVCKPGFDVTGCTVPDIHRDTSVTVSVMGKRVRPHLTDRITSQIVIEPSEGVAEIGLPSRSISIYELRENGTSITVLLCGESVIDGTIELNKVLSLSSSVFATALANLTLKWELPTADRSYLKVTVPPMPNMPPVNETVTLALSPAVGLYLKSGLLPSFQPLSFLVHDYCAGTECPMTSCPEGFTTSLVDHSCVECPRCTHGFCTIGPKCMCDPGYQGAHCGGYTTTAVAGVVASGAVIATVSLDVAMGGSIVAPINTITTLQLLYVIGSMPASNDVGRESVSGLKIIVYPFTIDYDGGGKHTKELLATLVLHVGLTLIPLLLLLIRWVSTPVSYRRTRSVAGDVLFPNLIVLVMHLCIVPLVTASISGISEGVNAVTVSSMLWTVCSVLGYFAFLVWFRFSRMHGPQSRVEYLNFNMGNSLSNATCAISSPKRQRAMPRCLTAWLPTGYWSCRHLKDRSFLHKYAVLFDDLLPESVDWYPMASFGRLVVLAALAAHRSWGGKARMVLVFVLSLCYLVTLLLKRPFKCMGSNSVSSVCHTCFTLATLVFLVWEAMVAPVLILMAVVVVGSAVWSAIVFLATKRRYDPEIVEVLGEEDLREDMAKPPTAAGEVLIDYNSSVTDTPEEVIEKTRTIGVRKWCELRGSVLLVYATPNHEEYERIHVLKDLKGVPVGDEGFALSEEDCKTAMAFMPLRYQNDWIYGILQLVSGTSRMAEAAVELAPKVDKSGDFVYFGDPVKTTHGEYTPCTPCGSSQHLLQHSIEKSAISASQLRVLSGELVVLSKLKSPFVVPVLTLFETDEKIAWVVPFQNGGSLQYHIEESGAFAECDAAFFIGEAILGLEHLHANNLLFKNLSCEDVLFTNDGHLMLADPGIPVGPVRHNKVGYQAPEVLMYEKSTKRSDYWSVGCVLFYMLHGMHPFEGRDRSTTAKLVLHVTPRVGDKFSSACHDFIKEALLVKEPSKRISSAVSIKSHRFFYVHNFRFSLLEDKQLPTPFLTNPPTPPSLPKDVEPPINPLNFVFNQNEEEN